MSNKNQDTGTENQEMVNFLFQQFYELLPIVKNCAEKFTEIRRKVDDISAENFQKMCDENEDLLQISMMVNKQLEIILENE